MRVYEGDFSLEGDKTVLVDVVLGLWFLALKRSRERGPEGDDARLLRTIVADNRSSVFPVAYFGDLVELLEAHMRDGQFALPPPPPSMVHVLNAPVDSFHQLVPPPPEVARNPLDANTSEGIGRLVHLFHASMAHDEDDDAAERARVQQELSGSRLRAWRARVAPQVVEVRVGPGDEQPRPLNPGDQSRAGPREQPATP